MELNILKRNEVGKGILIEMDAGYISPSEGRNQEIIKESKNFYELRSIMAELVDDLIHINRGN